MGRETSAWPCFPARASHAPNAVSHMSEPHALMGEAQICNYFVPIERTEPPCTYSNPWLWECWNALPASLYLVALAVPLDVSVFGCLD